MEIINDKLDCCERLTYCVYVHLGFMCLLLEVYVMVTSDRQAGRKADRQVQGVVLLCALPGVLILFMVELAIFTAGCKPTSKAKLFTHITVADLEI